MPRRRRRDKPDTRPRWWQAEGPGQIPDEKVGVLELCDRAPIEVKRIFWDYGEEAGRKAWQAWRSARVRGKTRANDPQTMWDALNSGQKR